MCFRRQSQLLDVDDKRVGVRELDVHKDLLQVPKVADKNKNVQAAVLRDRNLEVHLFRDYGQEIPLLSGLPS